MSGRPTAATAASPRGLRAAVLDLNPDVLVVPLVVNRDIPGAPVRHGGSIYMYAERGQGTRPESARSWDAASSGLRRCGEEVAASILPLPH